MNNTDSKNAIFRVWTKATLYEKVVAEQNKFRDWLLMQPPEEILNHAYEYTVREDFVVALENLPLEDGQTAVLLASCSPLNDLFEVFAKLETDHRENIRDCIENRANELLMEQRALPVYPHSVSYAQENKELEAYRASHQANVICKEAIEAAIAKHYRDNRLGHEAVPQVVDQFGYDRVFYVLAATVRDKDWDGRISFDNKQWARTVPIIEDIDDWNQDRIREFVVDKCNPGLIDLFLDQARHEYLLTRPLTNVDIEVEASKLLVQFQKTKEPNSPEGTHFMARLSTDFIARAGIKDQSRLMALLPFTSLSLSTLKDRKGVYAFISKDEDRTQPLRRGRAPERDKLQQKSSDPKLPASGEKKEQVR